MTFEEVLTQARAMLQRQGRVSYRALKRQFDLDDSYLDDLKIELIAVHQVAVDQGGTMLVWTGGATNGETAQGGNGEKEVGSAQLSVPLTHPPGPQTPNPELQTSQSPAGERRQLTVMFIDLVGSTTLSQQLDPEEYHARVRAYQTACGQVIARYEGHIAQYLGDGVLVYFGYPAAHEDDADRAVRSSLEIVAAVSQLPYTPPLQIRIGIHTGLVVVAEIGTGARTEQLALGETPNLAARVQGQAAPNTVVMSVATEHLVRGVFECRALGSQALKGVSAPLTLYHVVQESAALGRFEAATQTGLTPLVGREHEIALLLERWQLAQDGEGQVVLLSGEPGIGKSRIVSALRERLQGQGAQALRFQCSPYYINSALYPIIDNFERALKFGRDETPEAKLDKLEALIVTHYGRPPEDVRFVAAMLSIPGEERYGALAMTPQKHKDETLRSLVDLTEAAARKQPSVLLFEDVHWADPTSLEVLDLLIDRVRTTPLLLVLTHRPEFQSRWSRHGHVTTLNLSKLTRAQSSAIVSKLTSGKVLPAELLGQILAKTDGVPLFVEELTKTVMESMESRGSIASIGSAIPATLQDALMARLDRLGAAKEIAQMGAAIGREFSYELLAAVAAKATPDLDRALEQLTDSGLAFRRGAPPKATYTFKHALIQDMAYASLLKSTRQHYHQQIAQVLAERFPETVETQPELLAHHYTEAGRSVQAIPYWQQAGQRAVGSSANLEATQHFAKALDLLKILPDTPERIRQELTLQVALGPALIAIKGYTAPEVEQTYTRALELCRQMGETPQLFPVLRGLQVFYLVRGKLQTARELSEQLLTLARCQQDPLLLVGAHLGLGQTLYSLGELTSAREYVEQGLALYDPQRHGALTWAGGHPGMQCLAYAAWALWLLGYPDQALKRIHEALTLSQNLSHPLNLAAALHFAAGLHRFRREGQAAQGRAEAVITLATEQGSPYWLACGTIWRGWALAEQGQGEEGVAQIRQGLATYRTIGTEHFWPSWLALLAEAWGKVGQPEEGLDTLAEAVAVVDKNGERDYEAELYRLKGQLTLQSQVPSPRSKVEEEAEACFRQAIDIARRQQAKSPELRAVMSLARLWRQQGKKEDAHQMLAEIYGWFTEGFGTKDLQDAKALLDKLS